jgi:hypothetical protein
MDGENPTAGGTDLPPRLPSAPRRWAFWIAVAALLAAQLAMTAYFLPPKLVLDDEPISWLDFDTHVGQVWRFIESEDRWGEPWMYDPYQYAGYHSNTVFDADNKGWEVWTYALAKAGVPRAVAFDLFILFAHLLAPWLMFAAARMFGLDKWGAFIAALLGMSLWFFDAFPRWCWWIGMIAWAWAAILGPVAIAALYRFLRDGRRFHAIVCALVLAVGHLIHPYMFVAVAAPMAALYVRAFRRLSPARHLGVLAVAAFTVAVNAYWIAWALRFWHYVGDAGFCFQAGLEYLLTDTLGLMGKDLLVSGALGNRTAFRLACIAGALAALVCWRRSRDDRLLPFGVALGATFGVTYLGGYAWITTQIQPYRFVLPAIFLAVVPAAWFVAETLRSGALSKLPKLAYAALGVVAFVAIPALARDALYFFPAALPSQSPLYDVMPVPMGNRADAPIPWRGWHKQMELRPSSHFRDMNDLTRFVNEADKADGRILVEWYVLAEHLAWRTRGQFLGGFTRAEAHASASNLFQRDPEGLLPAAALKKYFEDYAVKWVIVTHKKRVEQRRDLLEPLGGIPPYDKDGFPLHRVYKTKIEVSYFAENGGRVQIDYNTIQVSGTDPKRDVVLRFHYLETLACEPGCALRREPLENDPVGFIRVPAPHPESFAIVNRYGAAR